MAGKAVKEEELFNFERAREAMYAAGISENARKRKEANERQAAAWYKRAKTPPRRNWGSDAPVAAAVNVSEVDVPDRLGKVSTEDLGKELKKHMESATYKKLQDRINVGTKVKIQIKGGKVVIRSEGEDVDELKAAVRKALEGLGQEGGRRRTRRRGTRHKSRG